MKSDQKEYALYSSTHIDPENANCQQLWKSDEPVLGEDWWQGGMRRSFRGAQKTLEGWVCPLSWLWYSSQECQSSYVIHMSKLYPSNIYTFSYMSYTPISLLILKGDLFLKKDQNPSFLTLLVVKLNNSTCLLNLKWQLEFQKQHFGKIVKLLHKYLPLFDEYIFFQFTFKNQVS